MEDFNRMFHDTGVVKEALARWVPAYKHCCAVRKRITAMRAYMVWLWRMAPVVCSGGTTY